MQLNYEDWQESQRDKWLVKNSSCGKKQNAKLRRIFYKPWCCKFLSFSDYWSIRNFCYVKWSQYCLICQDLQSSDQPFLSLVNCFDGSEILLSDSCATSTFLYDNPPVLHISGITIAPNHLSYTSSKNPFGLGYPTVEGLDLHYTSVVLLFLNMQKWQVKITAIKKSSRKRDRLHNYTISSPFFFEWWRGGRTFPQHLGYCS